ncbi:MAG: LpqB family beta-propeller domain-containing protein [Terracoccus sp.]
MSRPRARLGGGASGSRSRAVLVLLAAVLTMALAGCGGLPASGPVVDGRRLGESIQDPVRVSVQGPAPGASQESIASGFVRAGADTDETRQTGKEFLAPQSVDLWRWSTADIIIYDSLADGLTVRKLSADRVEVSIVAIARVSPEGRYEELAAGTVVKSVFGLTKVSGEWRIELPTTGFGLWLDSNSFDRLYVNQNVYYVTLTGRLLVPDSRWFPAGPRLTTSLARAQLEPVPPYLEGAVFTGVPPKAKLAVNAVPVDDGGRAVVDLSAAALDANPDARTAMWAQLTATLLQVGNVTQVSLTAEGAGLEPPDGRLTASSAEDLGFSQPPELSFDTALLRTGDKIRRIDPRFIPDSTVGGRGPDTKLLDVDVASIPTGWTSLALSTDGKQIAAVGGDGKDLSLWQASTKTLQVATFATDLIRPAYDPSGYLWVGGLDLKGAPQIFVFPPAVGEAPPTPVVVPASWLAGRRVVSLNVSPDGARLLVVTALPDGTGAQLGVSGITRSSNGQPTKLAGPLREGQPLTLVIDAVWLDATGYAVLGRIEPTEPVRPWLGSIGVGLEGVRRQGSPDPAANRLAPVADAQAITSVGGPRGLIIVTTSGEVLARAGASWRRIASGTNLLVPGG